MTDQSWPIDMNVFVQTAGGKAASLLPQLIPIYIEDGELLLGWMDEALQIGNATKLQQAAHRLKGNSASMGILTITKFADKLEALGKTQDLKTAVPTFTELSKEYAKVKLALLDMIGQVE